MRGPSLLTAEEKATLSKKELNALNVKRWRANKLSLGLCTTCGRNPIDSSNSSRCANCYEKRLAADLTRQRTKREAKRSAGLCLRCNTPSYGRALCGVCGDKERERMREFRRAEIKHRQANNLCLKCAVPLINGKVRCDSCGDTLNAYTLKRKRDLKKQAVEFLGGACLDCGLCTDVYTVYDFHHRDPSQKDFAISKVGIKDFETVIKPELLKCDLLCSNCHRTRHFRAGLPDAA